MCRVRKFLFVCLVTLLALALGVPGRTVFAGAGDLDPTFGPGGRVTTSIPDTARCSALALQPDGRLIVAGYVSTGSQWDFLLVRYTSDGRLDSTFGSNGVVLTDFLGTRDEAHAAVVQGDGKIVVAGSMSTPDSDFALARYNPDGSLDAAFGHGGKMVTGMGGQDIPFGLVIQPDGKLVAAGVSYQVTGADAKIALARYDSNGTLDPGFGAGQGKVLTSIANGGVQANAVALQPDGKIAVAGSVHCRYCADATDVMVARYTPSGSPDLTFGATGMVTTTLTGPYDSASGIVIQDDNRIVVAGTAGILPTLDVMLVRYDLSGSLDADFGAGGKVILDISGSDDYGQALSLQADGRILVAGVASWHYPGRDFALLRFSRQGALDPTFGQAGIISTDFDGQDDRACGMVVQPDGRIVVAGNVGDGLGLARYFASPPKLPRRAWLPIIWVGTSPG